MDKRSKSLMLVATAGVAVGWSGSAQAQCSTTTPAGGATTLQCGQDTATTLTTNTNGNAPATNAREQRFANSIVGRVTAGTDITGFGLFVTATGNQSIIFENNGTITNNLSNPDPDFNSLERGLQLRSNGGDISYIGNGSITTTNQAVAFAIIGRDTGNINVGTAAAPITGTFTGRTGASFIRFVTPGGTAANSPVGNINVFFQGGAFNVRPSENVGVGLAIEGQDSNINVVMTGNTVITSTGTSGGGGLLIEHLQVNSQNQTTMTVATDARMGTAASPLQYGIIATNIFSNQRGATTVSLTGTGSIFSTLYGISADGTEGGGDVVISTSAGSSISLSPLAGIEGTGIQANSFGTGAITINVGGSVTGGHYGIHTFQDTGAINVTIQQGATVSGSLFGFDYFRYDNAAGPSNILVLGTLSSPQTAARFTGTLQVGNGGTSGTLSGNVQNGGILIFNRSDASTYAGIVSGTGEVRHGGSGTTTLSGASTYTGGTTVQAGTLLVNGSVVGGTTVAAGGRLGGSGQIGTASVSGTVAPGSGGIGTLTTTGNVTFAAGSTFQVEVTEAGSSDRLMVGGTATLQGGTVSALFLGSQSNQCGAQISSTILTAQGGVTGTFAGVTSNFAFLTPSLSYNSNNVILTLSRNAATFSEHGATPNQQQTAGAAESLGCGNSVFNAVVQLGAAPARVAFDQLSGEIHPTARSALFDDSRFLREAMLAQPGGGRGAWLSAYGSWGEIEGNGNTAPLDRESAGLFLGLDLPLGGGWSAGVAGGVSRADFSLPARNSDADVTSRHVGVRLGGRFGGFGLAAGGAVSWHRIETGRTIVFTGFTDSPTARYDGRTVQLFGELGYRLPLGAATIEPFAGLAWVDVETDGFTEAGGAAALTGESRSESATFGTLGVRGVANLGPLHLGATAGWRRAFDLDASSSRLAFASSPATRFTVTGAPVSENALLLEAGASLGLGGTARIGISYSGRFGDRGDDHGARAMLSIPF